MIPYIVSGVIVYVGVVRRGDTCDENVEEVRENKNYYLNRVGQ